jgi:hypothetical protein
MVDNTSPGAFHLAAIVVSFALAVKLYDCWRCRNAQRKGLFYDTDIFGSLT